VGAFQLLVARLAGWRARLQGAPQQLQQQAGDGAAGVLGGPLPDPADSGKVVPGGGLERRLIARRVPRAGCLHRWCGSSACGAAGVRSPQPGPGGRRTARRSMGLRWRQAGRKLDLGVWLLAGRLRGASVSGAMGSLATRGGAESWAICGTRATWPMRPLPPSVLALSAGSYGPLVHGALHARPAALLSHGFASAGRPGEPCWSARKQCRESEADHRAAALSAGVCEAEGRLTHRS